MEVVNVRKYKAGYEIRTEELTAEEAHAPGGMQMKSAYTPEGLYIGSSKWAHRLIVKRGIKPELRQEQDLSANGGRGFPCSIGFCEKEQKWAGWSHRAICSFGLGDKLFEADYGDDDTPFVQHGEVVIETLAQARQAACNFAEFVN